MTRAILGMGKDYREEGEFVNYYIWCPLIGIYKTRVQLDPIQDRLDLHPVFSFLVMDFLVDLHNAKKKNRMLYFQPPSGNELNRSTLPSALTGTHKFC